MEKKFYYKKKKKKKKKKIEMLGLENKEINQFPTPQDDLFKGEYKILKGKKFSYLINEKNDEIGKGAYGKVFKAKRIKDKIVVAMKKSQIENNSYNLVFPDSTLKEISILFYLKNHKNIVKYVLNKKLYIYIF